MSVAREVEVAPRPTVSVVLCTAGRRPQLLQRCLASLAAVQGDGVEIVVVDNAPIASLGVAAAAAGIARYVHEPRVGLDAARNRGVAETVGEVVAFVDDDCEVDPGWLDAVRDAFVDPVVGLVTGRVRAASLTRPTERWFEGWFSFDRGPVDRRYERAQASCFPGEVGTGCNMAYRRSLLEQVGPFDERIEVGTSIGGGGDIDMFARALDAGAVVAYAASALVHHHHRVSMRELRGQFWGYGTSFGALCLKFALTRPNRRGEILRHYRSQLHRHARRCAGAALGRNDYPVHLLALLVVSELWGPIAYALARVRPGPRAASGR